jgi:hypothetical protein
MGGENGMYEQKDKSKIAAGLSLVAGIWLMLSVFMMGMGITSNIFAVGLLVVIFSLIELSSMEATKWVSWINGILGLWLIVSPWVFKGMIAGELWNSLVLGVIVIGISLWGGMSSRMGMGHPKAG